VIVALWTLLAGLAQAQDPPPFAPLARDLEERIDKLGPVSFKVRLEAVDSKGQKTLKHQVDLYLHLAKGGMILRTLEMRPDETATYRFAAYEGFESFLSWVDSGSGERVNLRPIWRWIHELNSEVDRLFDPAGRPMPFDEWHLSAKHNFVLDVAPDESGTMASFRLALGKGVTSSISWLEAIRRAGKGDVLEGTEEVTLTDKVHRKTTVIDRKTGFPRSIHLTLESGEGRELSLSDFKGGAEKPDYKRPKVVRESRLWPEDACTVGRDSYQAQLAGIMQRILDQWAGVGAPTRADALKTFLTALGARHDSAMRFAASRRWTESFLDACRSRGEKLPAPEDDLRPLAKRLKEYVGKGEKNYAENFTELRDQFSDRLQDQVIAATAPKEARDALRARVREALDPKLIDAARAKLPEPVFDELLRESLRKDAKQSD
jgi:hypothetical protein